MRLCGGTAAATQQACVSHWKGTTRARLATIASQMASSPLVKVCNHAAKARRWTSSFRYCRRRTRKTVDGTEGHDVGRPNIHKSHGAIAVRSHCIRDLMTDASQLAGACATSRMVVVWQAWTCRVCHRRSGVMRQTLISGRRLELRLALLIPLE